MPDDEHSFDLDAQIANLARSDGGHVILAVAAVAQLLEVLLLAYLPKLSDEHATLLFSDRGPLGHFLAKAKLALALGLIESETYQDLKGAQRVRNAFAHPRGLLRFNSPKVDTVFKSIRHWPETDNPRALFDERLGRAALAMKAKADALLFKHACE